MISEMKIQTITISITFVMILCLTSIISAKSVQISHSKYHQMSGSQLSRVQRSADEYDDSLTPDLYQPLLKEHSFLRSASKRAAAMGVDLPDYILHYKGNNWPNLGSFREKMQKSGK